MSEPEPLTAARVACVHEHGADFADNPSRFRCLDCGETVIDSPAQGQATYIAVMIAHERAQAFEAGAAAERERLREITDELIAAVDARDEPNVHGWSRALRTALDG